MSRWTIIWTLLFACGALSTSCRTTNSQSEVLGKKDLSPKQHFDAIYNAKKKDKLKHIAAAICGVGKETAYKVSVAMSARGQKKPRTFQQFEELMERAGVDVVRYGDANNARLFEGRDVNCEYIGYDSNYIPERCRHGYVTDKHGDSIYGDPIGIDYIGRVAKHDYLELLSSRIFVDAFRTEQIKVRILHSQYEGLANRVVYVGLNETSFDESCFTSKDSKDDCKYGFVTHKYGGAMYGDIWMENYFGRFKLYDKIELLDREVRVGKFNQKNIKVKVLSSAYSNMGGKVGYANLSDTSFARCLR